MNNALAVGLPTKLQRLPHSGCSSNLSAGTSRETSMRGSQDLSVPRQSLYGSTAIDIRGWLILIHCQPLRFIRAVRFLGVRIAGEGVASGAAASADRAEFALPAFALEPIRIAESLK